MIRLAIGALALLFVLSPVAAPAQDWPAKQPIKVIVPFTAGSATDIVGRIVFEQVGKQIGQNFVFENRGGAGTTLGAAMVAKADPDGYTLLVNSTSQVVVASTYAKLPYNVAEDFVPISALADIPFVVVDDDQLQVDEGCRGCQQQAGRHLLRLQRAGQFGSSVHGGAAPGRRLSDHACAVPGDGRGHDRSDRGTHRHVSGACAQRDQSDQGGQGQFARGQFAEAAAADARRADLGRGRSAQGSIPVLGRRLRAGEDAEGDRRAAQSRGCRGAAA